jgi:signal transduction histidine kinase
MNKYFTNLRKEYIVVIGILLTVLVGFIDSKTGNEISFSFFYLLPISFITWFTNKKTGILFAVVCATIWYYVDKENNPVYSNQAIPLWNSMVRFGFFMVVLFLISKFKSLNEELELIVAERTSRLKEEASEHLKAKTEITKQSNELRRLTQRIQTIKDEENIKIAREIHDELGQSLTAINLELMWISKKYSNQADIVSRMSALSEIVNDTIKTIRKISSSLRPRLLDQLGIFAAIRAHALDFSRRTGIECIIELPDVQDDLDPLMSTSLFRIYQEAVTNIARHSAATKAEVIVRLHEDKLHMIIKDNGVGLTSTNGKSAKEMTLGILGMKERTKILDGELIMNSTNGSGTEIILIIPIKNIKTETL